MIVRNAEIAALGADPLADLKAKFKSKLAEFRAAVSAFISGNARVPSYKSRVAKLKARVAALPPGSVPSSILGRIQGVESAVSGLGLTSKISNAIAKARDFAEALASKHGLGVEPVTITIAIASMVTALALLNTWNTHERNVRISLENEEKKLALVEAGLLPADVIGKPDEEKPGTLDKAKDLVTLAILGGAALLFLPKLMRRAS
ncbi:MAG TPA: hypothetical protein PKI22_08795 [Hydrogenophilus thermoluteolus]|nr:hypothetical protein [Hydrogenophilus thermoluteolus]